LSEVEKSIGTAPLLAENMKVCKPHHNCFKKQPVIKLKKPQALLNDLNGIAGIAKLNKKGWKLLGRVNTL
jgi:hypothetical protein